MKTIVFSIVAVLVLLFGSIISGRRMANDSQRALLRKWCAIASAGVIALIFVPSLLAVMEIIEEKNVVTSS